MTSLMNWLSPSAMQSLGWALLHFLWQGTALAALAAGAMALCRRTSARYIVGVAGSCPDASGSLGHFLLSTCSITQPW